MILKEYQEIAVKELLTESSKLLRHRGKKLIFKAPTGSGKTIMIAEFLKQFAIDSGNTKSCSFIWIAPRQLHIQSHDKLELYYKESQALRCVYFEELDDNKIGDDEILFFNWESINARNEKDRIYVRENEQEFYLSKVLENTRDAGNQIILVVDESHFANNSENAERLKIMFDAELTIEVSATPVFLNPDGIVSVDVEDVKDEGMIKKSVILNEDIKNTIKNGQIQSELSHDSDELVIEKALKKREELIKLYNKEGSKVNPLIIIQLPSVIRQEHEDLKTKIIYILESKYNINTTNGKLAIYLAEQHENLDEIAKNENGTNVLLFKYGIALGWDCPRAQIMVLFREWHSETFSIQTVGRIMRMPEPLNGHYKNDILNHAYVFTNLSNIQLLDEYAKSYITIYKSYKEKKYKPINLISYHSKRHREKTRLSPEFVKTFLKLAEKRSLNQNIDLNQDSIHYSIISDWESVNINQGITEIGETVDYDMTEEELQKYFNNFAAICLRPQFYPEQRSVGRVKDSIYRFFDNSLQIKYELKQNEIIKTVLNAINIQKFKDVIDESKAEYLSQVIKREKEIQELEDWNIPDSIRFNSRYHQEKFSKSIMQPFFADGNWNTEKRFIEYLEMSNKVEWWFKSGERDAVYFAIPYNYQNQTSLFYVDFIIQFKDGSIGLFDTKSGFTLRDPITKAKSDALRDYMKKYKQKKLWGGIVTNTDQIFFNARWVYFDNISEELIDRDFSNWKNLDI